MARQDYDELTVVVFVSTDSIELPHNFRTKLDDANHPEEERTTEIRSDSLKSRSGRPTVVVCLGLLCVLLPLVVTLLCATLMKGNDQETTNYWRSLSKNLTEERHQLREELVKLQARLNDNDHCSDNPKWISYNHSSYFISSMWKNWTESRRDCLQRGADLIIINDREEQKFIKEVTNGNIAWIGLSDSDEEGVWKWVDGSALNSGAWEPGEPNEKISDEDCAVSLFDWADYPCSYTFVWICERELEV